AQTTANAKRRSGSAPSCCPGDQGKQDKACDEHGSHKKYTQSVSFVCFRKSCFLIKIVDYFPALENSLNMKIS
ncbi:hypothetical protein AB9F39_35900, partial [Rhizobium leguminosarum]|uniref:hypothetical protein n=1 Tax=Rhizobium leguminosarum TaxID=384 RepID=UPI003F9EAFA3